MNSAQISLGFLMREFPKHIAYIIMELAFEKLTEVVRRRMRNVMRNAWWLRSPRINYGFEFQKPDRRYCINFCRKCGNYDVETASPMMAPLSVMCLGQTQEGVCRRIRQWLRNAKKSVPAPESDDDRLIC